MPTPLQRLQVNDGMLITADHWQIAHSYHRQRQAIHYESLHTGGIASGLGVSIGPIPEAAASQYRRPRWLTIQPGLAIDDFGNPVVVAQAESYYLSAQPTESTLIYVVLKYSDPRHLERSLEPGAAVVQEAFQIVEKDSPAVAGEIELCRVQLLPDAEGIAPPRDVFVPGDNQLDLRYRPVLDVRAQQQLTLSSWSAQESTKTCFQALLAGGRSLYSTLCGEWIDDPNQSDLSHLPYHQFCQLDYSQQQQLARYLERGGVVVVEASTETAAKAIAELYQVEAELRRTAAANRLAVNERSALAVSVAEELREIQACLSSQLSILASPLRSFIEEQQLPEAAQSALDSHHPVRSYPFPFGQLPTINDQPIGARAWGGLILLIGPLIEAWNAAEQTYLTREEIRSAQEFGMNLLSFAARRRQMQQFLDAANLPKPSVSAQLSQESK